MFLYSSLAFHKVLTFCLVSGYSRFIVNPGAGIQGGRIAADVEIVLQRAKEAFPDVHPQVILDILSLSKE